MVSLDRYEPFEHDLGDSASEPHAVVWHSAEPMVVLGASQSRLASAVTGLPVTCRRSGGGAVLIGPWLVNVAVRLPASRFSIRAGVDWLGTIHLAALAEVGAHAVRADEPGRESVPWACFGSVARGELVAAGRKLTGIAQERRQTGIALVAGTLVTPPDWRLLCDAMGSADDACLLAASTISCADLAAVPPSVEGFAVAIARQLSVDRHVRFGSSCDFDAKL